MNAYPGHLNPHSAEWHANTDLPERKARRLLALAREAGINRLFIPESSPASYFREVCERFGIEINFDSASDLQPIRAQESLTARIHADRRAGVETRGLILYADQPDLIADAAIGPDANPTLRYYEIVRGYQIILASAEIAQSGRSLEAMIWLSNADTVGYGGAVVEAKLIGASGEVYGEAEHNVSFPAGASVQVGQFSARLGGSEPVYFLDLWLFTLGNVVNFNTRYRLNGNRGEVARTAITARRNDTAGFLTIANVGDDAVLDIQIAHPKPDGADYYAYFGDNHLDILPGETRVLSLEWADTPEKSRTLIISGQNCDPIEV